MIVTTVLQLKAEGFRPGRGIILALSGDEETSMRDPRAGEGFPDAEFVLNGDGGGGKLDTDGKPVVYDLQAGEDLCRFRVHLHEPRWTLEPPVRQERDRAARARDRPDRRLPLPAAAK